MNTHALLEKYCKSGPRYTSYPTAPYFDTRFTDLDWAEELAFSRQYGRGLSIYTHIPFCDTLCWYCGCNMIATRDYGRAERYLETLFKEIEHTAADVGNDRVVEQIHWGGGTPTFLRPNDLTQLFSQIDRYFEISSSAEIGCEVDPRELTREHVKTLRELGFNRISLGVQDIEPRVQESVNRIQPEALIREVYAWMREAQFDSVNMDLMVGLPFQTVDSFTNTLDAVIDMRPDRLAVFNYAHVPWMKKHQKLIPESSLPDLHTRLALQILILERLTEAGYVYIGMDHYAMPNDELVVAQRAKTLYRNFQGYTTHKDCDILAFGISAISQTEQVYAQNLKIPSEYRARVDAGRYATERGLRISDDDRIRRAAITQIMCDLELDTDEFGRRWKLDFSQYFDCDADLLELEADGLVSIDKRVLRVTESGRLFLRNIAMLFDGNLRQAVTDAGEQPRYSRTV